MQPDDLSVDSIARFAWPDFGDPLRISGPVELARRYHAAGYAVVIIKDLFTGIFKMSQRIIGMEPLLLLLCSEPKRAALLFYKMDNAQILFDIF